MRIITKQKDCYDYFTGIYGIDDKKVLDRRGWEKNKPVDSLFPDEDKMKLQVKSLREISCIARTFFILGKRYRVLYSIDNKVFLEPETKNWRGQIMKNPESGFLFNNKLRLPFLTTNTAYKTPTDKNLLPIILDNWGLCGILDLNNIYQELDLFLGYLVDNPPIENNQTDKEKIHSHGFDIKKSFRHRK